MKLLVVSDAPILKKDGKLQAYAPYVKEMNLWISHVKETTFVSPTRYNKRLLTAPFSQQNIVVRGLRRLEFNTFIAAIISFLTVPYQFYILSRCMLKADHIHLRAPGNLCLLACVVQIFFSRKRKTVKYAGNWDPNAKQPFAYRIQKWILSNTFLSKNIQVLVYGDWPEQSKNIKSFFTATYIKHEIESIVKKFDSPFKALFVGTMGDNKRPLETVQCIKMLRSNGIDISLEMFGEGSASEDIKRYRSEHGLENIVSLRGNQPAAIVQEAYKSAHFVFLLSKSEGWPKAVAEAMFWGAIPIATPVSCVPWMLDQGKRGFILDDWGEETATTLSRKLEHKEQLQEMSLQAQKWSQQYTLDSFDNAITELL